MQTDASIWGRWGVPHTLMDPTYPTWVKWTTLAAPRLHEAELGSNQKERMPELVSL